MSFLGFTGTRLGSEVSCPRTLIRKNPEDPVRLESRTPGLRVKHFTTEPRETRIAAVHDPPNSPDSVPSDFQLFPKLKSLLPGRQFGNNPCCRGVLGEPGCNRLPREDCNA